MSGLVAPLAVAVLTVAIGGVGAPIATGSLPVGRPPRPSGSGSWSAVLDPLRGRAWARLVVRARRPSGGGTEGEVGEVARLRASVASGGSVLAAFAVLARAGGPWSPPADALVRRVAAGTSLASVLDGWVDDGGGRALVADALAIATSTGGSQAAALEAVGRTLAERRALEREIRALASQAVASAVVVVAAPVGFAVLVAAVDGRVRHLLTGTALGVACIVLGLALDAFGGWWMVRLVRRVR